MLLTADSLWKYIQSCHNIYCLPLHFFYYFENWDKQILFWHSQLFCVFHLLPLHPQLFSHNINTDCPNQDGNGWWELWKREWVIIRTHTAIRHNVSHRYMLLIHMQKLKRSEKHIQRECVTKYNTHTHTHTLYHKTHQNKTLTSCSTFTVRTNCM